MSTQSNNKEEKKKNENENGNGNDDEGQKPVNVKIEAGLYHSLKSMAHAMFQDKNLDRLLRHLYEQETKKAGEETEEVTENIDNTDTVVEVVEGDTAEI